MTPTTRSVLVAFSLMGLSAGVADDATTVSRHGFCIRLDEMRCGEVALPGTMVAFDRLSTLEDGSRVVWYFTDQEISGKAVLVHVLEAEDSETALEIKPSASVAKDAKKLSSALKKLGEKVAGQGSVVATPFRGESGESFRVFTPLKIDGPGIYTGKVVDLDGKIVPTSEKTSFSVFRRPSQ